MSEDAVTLEHPRFRFVDAAIFTRKLVADCMTHQCAMVEENHAEKLDACCQYGCDVDLGERDAILTKTDDIRPLLRDEAQAVPWFEDEIEEDPDYPSGGAVRTSVFQGGCVFLAHDRRGCAIHRASIERGWGIHGIKPAVCRLFPLSYGEEWIVIADEYEEYSCAHVDGPTLYRITRDTFGELFGPELVAALDDAEQRVLARQPRKLPVITGGAANRAG